MEKQKCPQRISQEFFDKLQVYWAGQAETGVVLFGKAQVLRAIITTGILTYIMKMYEVQSSSVVLKALLCLVWIDVLLKCVHWFRVRWYITEMGLVTRIHGRKKLYLVTWDDMTTEYFVHQDSLVDRLFSGTTLRLVSLKHYRADSRFKTVGSLVGIDLDSYGELLEAIKRGREFWFGTRY